MNAPLWPIGLDGIGFGGDYNPEQWPLDVQLEDIELMREAGISIVSVAIFSWAMLEPREGEYQFEWLDDVLDRLHTAGIRVSLATATASPPPWLTTKYPEILPQRADGTILWPGSRQGYAVSSPVYRRYVLGLTRRVAERYRTHPALAVWHVDNELGCHAPHDFSDVSAAEFRRWLERRYGSVEALNDAWGTTFWSQRYSDFAEILPPRTAPATPNPTQQLDFARYSSDAVLSIFTDIRDVLREITPGVPITTNLMATTLTKWLDYFRWAPEMDLISNDHYLVSWDPESEIDLAFSADLTRGIAGGHPWFLMEHSTSAVNWQPRNRAKGPGEMLRNSFAHVARGADAVLFFQWRASAAGSEKFHSALLPHAGTDSTGWRQTVELGEALRSLAAVRGSLVRASVALVFDYPAWWASELDSHPNNSLRYLDRMMAHYRELWRQGVTVDIVPVDADLSRYQLVIAPTLYAVGDAAAQRIADAAKAGATVVISYWSGIVDELDHVRLGGYPGAFRELLGVRTDEFFPLQDGEVITLDDGSVADFWAERIELRGAEAVRTFTDGPLAGGPAVTYHAVGSGSAWYVGTRLDAAALGALTERWLAEAGVAPVAEVPPGVEVVRRHGDGESFLFVLNHTDTGVALTASGRELLTGAAIDGTLVVAPFGAAVVRETGAH